MQENSTANEGHNLTCNRKMSPGGYSPAKRGGEKDHLVKNMQTHMQQLHCRISPQSHAYCSHAPFVPLIIVSLTSLTLARPDCASVFVRVRVRVRNLSHFHDSLEMG